MSSIIRRRRGLIAAIGFSCLRGWACTTQILSDGGPSALPAQRFSSILKMKLQASEPSGPESLQSQTRPCPKNRLSISRLGVVHGRRISAPDGKSQAIRFSRVISPTHHVFSSPPNGAVALAGHLFQSRPVEDDDVALPGAC